MRGYWSGHKVLDPTELEARFSNEDGLAFLDMSGTETLSDEGQEQLERVKKILPMLPDREADFVELYYFHKLKQTDIATIFRVSQPTVCYRLQRAAKRIRYLLSLPDLGTGELDSALEGFLSDPLDIRIMVLMHETTCQSEVAKRLSVTQGLVRHRFLRTIARMGWEQRTLRDENGEARMDEDGKPMKEWYRIGGFIDVGMEKYATMFKCVLDNLNILREVERPAWGPRITHALE